MPAGTPVTAPADPADRSEPSGHRDRVELRMPADSVYLAVLRTATAGLAARLDFTLDEIEDLRIAVDEACALLLQQTARDAELTCVFELLDEALAVRVSVPTNHGQLPERGNFGWAVLRALAGDVDAGVDPGGAGGDSGGDQGEGTPSLWISMRKQRGAS